MGVLHKRSAMVGRLLSARLLSMAFALAGVSIMAASGSLEAAQAELSVEDFTFEGPLGSEGASIRRLGRNHFKVTLGPAPGHPDWANKLQFKILRHAKGNSLRLDVVFEGGSAYRFNEYFHSWSYDGVKWQPIRWQRNTKISSLGDVLVFPEFTEDQVYVGHQVPMSYEDVVALVDRWKKHPSVKVRVLGKSLGGRNVYRIEITDPGGATPRQERWVHYFANQHPGEHNSQWRMVGMVDWLLGDAGADCRRRSICHFVMMMSADAPSHGWYRVNAQGVDMNRSYLVEGADADKQPHEAFICQKDLEKLMSSDCPVTDVWSMHTWGGVVEPILLPGPEMGTAVGPWTELRDIIKRNDPKKLIEPLKVQKKKGNPTYWSDGPHAQFGVSAVLCEGGGAIFSKKDNVESGTVLMKSIAQHYSGTRKTVERGQ